MVCFTAAFDENPKIISLGFFRVVANILKTGTIQVRFVSK